MLHSPHVHVIKHIYRIIYRTFSAIYIILILYRCDVMICVNSVAFMNYKKMVCAVEENLENSIESNLVDANSKCFERIWKINALFEGVSFVERLSDSDKRIF